MKKDKLITKQKKKLGLPDDCELTEVYGSVGIHENKEKFELVNLLMSILFYEGKNIHKKRNYITKAVHTLREKLLLMELTVNTPLNELVFCKPTPEQLSKSDETNDYDVLLFDGSLPDPKPRPVEKLLSSVESLKDYLDNFYNPTDENEQKYLQQYVDKIKSHVKEVENEYKLS